MRHTLGGDGLLRLIRGVERAAGLPRASFALHLCCPTLYLLHHGKMAADDG